MKMIIVYCARGGGIGITDIMIMLSVIDLIDNRYISQQQQQRGRGRRRGIRACVLQLQVSVIRAHFSLK
jgi:hypothetical protein